MLIATALTLAVTWAAGHLLCEFIGRDRDKILAALHGRSWVAEGHAPARPVTVRLTPRCRAAAPALLPAGMRAAA